MPYLCLLRRKSCAAGDVLFGYSGAIFERLKISFHRPRWRKTRLSCTTGFGRCDYLDFLPKRPQGTTKILGTLALAGTKTPAALKFSSKDATTDCAETPVNCPHCGQKWPGEASVPTPAVYPAFFFVLEKAAKSEGNAVIPTLPMHRSHGLQHLWHKRLTFAFAGESGYTLAFANRIAHSGSHGKTGAFLSADTAWLCFASEIATERTAGGSGCTPVPCVRFLRRRGPAGLRDLFCFCRNCGLYALRSGPFRVCEARGGITTLSALYVLLKRRTAACKSGYFAVF